MSGSNIEAIALDWMAARMVREHVHKLRGECVCAHEVYLADEEIRTGTPCWKVRAVATSEDTCTYEPHRPVAQWCPACVKRTELHERLLKARKREGGCSRRGSARAGCMRDSRASAGSGSRTAT